MGNLWFPIINVALARHYPAAHARFFLNLSQTEGPEAALSVQTMVERLRQMEDPGGPYGPQGRKARKLLETRGLTSAALAEVQTLLASLPSASTPPAAISLEQQQAEIDRAEKAAWDWYLEWSQIARVAINNRALLRQLGFLRSTGKEEGVLPDGGAATVVFPEPPNSANRL